jgi:hypothetical protein
VKFVKQQKLQCGTDPTMSSSSMLSKGMREYQVVSEV